MNCEGIFMKGNRKTRVWLLLILALLLVLPSGLSVAAAAEPAAEEEEIVWEVWREENFQEAPAVPNTWTPDNYDIQDDYFFGEKGYGIEDLFRVVGGEEAVAKYREDLIALKAFRQSYTYGDHGWLTIEAYGISKDGGDQPDSGGQFVLLENGGGAKLVCQEHTDAIIIRSTTELPQTYKLEVKVKNIDLGGKKQDAQGHDIPDRTQEAWTVDGKMNGYDEDTAMSLRAGPWRPNGETWNPDDPYATAYDQNGGYFLSIVDYENPKPHNNIFIHHHRKVAMDTDNNIDFGEGGTWSKVWNGTEYVDDGSRYISMLWANGNHPDLYDEAGNLDRHKWIQYLATGQKFYSFRPSDGEARVNTVEMVDKYIPGETYTFTIIRTPEYYEMSVSGIFYYGGDTTYCHRKYHLPDEQNKGVYTWHFNQKTEELQGQTPPTDNFQLSGQPLDTWPAEATYPDYFFTGMPHINYYAGSMTYTNLTLSVPQGTIPPE